MKRILLTALVLISVQLAAHGEAVKVSLKPAVEVTPAETITVADLGSLQGPKPAVEKAGGVVIGSGPLPGQKRTIESSYIRTRLASAGISEEMVVTGAGAVSVVGKCTRFAAGELAARAKDYVAAMLPTGDYTCELTVAREPRELVVGGNGAEVRPRLLGTSARLGLNTVALDAVVDGRVVSTTSASIEARAAAEVLVVTGTVRQGEPLTADNTTWEPRDITRTPDAIVRTGESDLSRLVARRTLTAGALLRPADVTTPLAVRRGDSVTVVVKCGVVTLTTTAEAKQDGREGDTIRVRSQVSSQDATARVISAGLVEISR